MPVPTDGSTRFDEFAVDDGTALGEPWSVDGGTPVIGSSERQTTDSTTIAA